VLIASVLALFPLAAAAKPSWDQGANIKTAAEHLAQIQRSAGLPGALQFIAACYKTHGLASNYSQPFEACIVQDYILTKVAAAIYQRLPQDAREKLRTPDPEAMLAAMSRRVSQAFAQYKVPDNDARHLLARVDREGLAVFSKASSPENPSPPEQSNEE
jgi:hypothetical protein